MVRYYLRWVEPDGSPTRLDPIGPYPTRKMADFMKGNYEVVLKKKSEVVEIEDDESSTVRSDVQEPRPTGRVRRPRKRLQQK